MFAEADLVDEPVSAEVSASSEITDGAQKLSAALQLLRSDVQGDENAYSPYAREDAKHRLAGLKRKATHMSELLNTALLRTPGVAQHLTEPGPTDSGGAADELAQVSALDQAVISLNTSTAATLEPRAADELAQVSALEQAVMTLNASIAATLEPWAADELVQVSALDQAVMTLNASIAATLEPYVAAAVRPAIVGLWGAAEPDTLAVQSICDTLVPRITAAMQSAESDAVLSHALRDPASHLPQSLRHYFPQEPESRLLDCMSACVAEAVSLRRFAFGACCVNTERLHPKDQSKALQHVNTGKSGSPINLTDNLSGHVMNEVPNVIQEAQVAHVMRTHLEHAQDSVDVSKIVAAAHIVLTKYLKPSNFIFKAGCTDSATQVNVTAPGVFRAAIQLRTRSSCDPVRVAIFADGPQQAFDPWRDVHSQRSQHGELYSSLTALATRALAFFRARARLGNDPCPGGVALSDLLHWLALYRIRPLSGPADKGPIKTTSLFSQPSQRTKFILAVDLDSHTLMPPIFRSFRISSADLKRAAINASHALPALHMIDVPQDDL